MRTIKFRFWNKLAFRFQPAGKYAIDGEGKLVSYDYEAGGYDDPIDFSDSIIVPQQYTGLKDKNGKEIYEGDIVSLFNSKDPEETYEIVWEDDECRFALVSEGGYGDFFKPKDREVIGNIFENSELLKQ